MEKMIMDGVIDEEEVLMKRHKGELDVGGSYSPLIEKLVSSQKQRWCLRVLRRTFRG